MKSLTVAALTLASTLAVTIHAQQPASSAANALTALDYVAIEQLAARYAFAIDNCTKGGVDFADLFVDDGEFSVSQEWGVAGARPTKGRAALIEAAGGDGKGNCKDPKTQMGYGISHITVNHIITPTPTGATGRSYLLAIGVGGNPTTIERQGGYDDVYVRTAGGWRFKSRVHVFPNMRESVQFGRRGGGPAAPAPAAAPATPASPAPPAR